jgi:hypothetical protein
LAEMTASEDVGRKVDSGHYTCPKKQVMLHVQLARGRGKLGTASPADHGNLRLRLA